MSLFQKNWDNFITSNPRFVETSEDLKQKASVLADESDGIKEIEEWKKNEVSKAIILPHYTARLQSKEEEYQELLSSYPEKLRVKNYLDVHEDLHLYQLSLRIRNAIKEVDFDENDIISVSGKNIPLLIAVGCGDGSALAWFIQTYQPYNILVVVPEWEHFVSSFNHLDWETVNQYYSTTKHRSINFIRPKAIHELINAVASMGLCMLEHAYIYRPLGDDEKIETYVNEITGRRIKNLVPYCGYTIDEYNMVYNTAINLTKKPAVFRSPAKKLKRKVLVCGSGPSLDKSIETIRMLSNDHIIICGGSNYQALTKAGIHVDCLVLVERADDVYHSYQKIYDNVGKTSTKLLMSSTCHQQLFDLFDDVGIFYRPALTPLSMFSDSRKQILSLEGPQAVCAAVSLACELGPSQLCLIGVDFGSSDERLQRSKDAVGYSPQEWKLTHKGNLKDTVFTNERLLDCCDAVQTRLRMTNNEFPVYNLSDGIFIEGTIPYQDSCSRI